MLTGLSIKVTVSVEVSACVNGSVCIKVTVSVELSACVNGSVY